MIAARATFALKAGVWLRRGRLFVVSPDSQAAGLIGFLILIRRAARKGTANRGASDNHRHGLKPASKGPPTQDVPEASSSCEFEIQPDHRHLPAMSEAFDPEDFSFVVKMRGAPAKPWVWEIHRAGKSGPVERSPVCYASMAEAVREGKKALARLLMAAA